MNLPRRPPPRSRRRRAPSTRAPLKAGPPPLGERILVAAALGVAALGLSLWLAGGLSFLVHGRRFDSAPASSSLGLALAALTHPKSPALGWPPRLRADLLPPGLLYLVAAGALAGALCPFALGRRRRPARSPHPASWATRKEADKVLVSGGSVGRLVVGRSGGDSSPSKRVTRCSCWGRPSRARRAVLPSPPSSSGAAR